MRKRLMIGASRCMYVYGADLATLIPNTQVVIRVTGTPRAALEDVGLTDGTLLMPVYDDSVQG